MSNDAGSNAGDDAPLRPQDLLAGRGGRSETPAADTSTATDSASEATSGRKRPPKPKVAADDATAEQTGKAPKAAPSTKDTKPATDTNPAKGAAAAKEAKKAADKKPAADAAPTSGAKPAADERLDDDALVGVGSSRAALDPADRRLAWFISSTVLVGFVLRIVQLGNRALHHDESLDAWWSYRYLNGTYEGYDPVYHGPLRFYITALFYWLFGESPATSRLFSALAGTALIAVAWFMRHHIGRIASGVLAVLLCLSPSLLYYSRFGREDAQIVFLTGLMLAVTMAYFKQPRAWQPSVVALALSASLAIKESTYLLIFQVGAFVLVTLAVQFRRVAVGTSDDDDASDAFAWQLPLAALALMVITVILATRVSAFLMFGLYGAVLAAVAIVFARQANRRSSWTDAPFVARVSEVGWKPWALAGFLLVFTFIAFFTVFFTRPGDWHTGITEAIGYWDSQNEVNRGGQPWYYYFVVIPAYEFVAIALAIVGTVIAFRRQSFSLGLVGWLAVSSLIVYSYAGERMPWLVVHPLLPIVILSAVGAQALWKRRTEILPQVAMAALAAAFLFTIFSGLRLSFPNGTDGRELLVQGAQATDHVPEVLDYVESLADLGQAELGRDPSLAVGHELSWPWGWYFRDFGYLPFTDTGDLPDHDIILVASHVPLTEEIASNYQVTKFALRGWWVPAWVQSEVTRDNETTGEPETITESTVGGYFAGGPSGWLDWQFTREAWPEREDAGIGCGSADQHLLIRNDLAAVADKAVGLGLLEPLVIEPLPCVSADLRVAS